MRLLVDENLPPAVSAVLRQLEHDVVDVRTRLRKSPDEVVWMFAAEEERILITRDLDFPLSNLPRPPGLVLVRLSYWFISDQITRFVSNWARSARANDVIGRITVITTGRPRTRDF